MRSLIDIVDFSVEELNDLLQTACDISEHPEKYWDEASDYAPIVMAWPTLKSGLDVFTWTGGAPDTNYTVYEGPDAVQQPAGRC